MPYEIIRSAFFIRGNNARHAPIINIAIHGTHSTQRVIRFPYIINFNTQTMRIWYGRNCMRHPCIMDFMFYDIFIIFSIVLYNYFIMHPSLPSVSGKQPGAFSVQKKSHGEKDCLKPISY